MTNDKDSAVLAERVERVTKWLDGGCSTWGTPAQDIREVINALRQPTQSDALREALERIEAQATEIERLLKLLNAWTETACEHLDTELAGLTFAALRGAGYG